MSYPHSLVTICPDAAKAALLALGEAVGVSGGMSVPLSADGNDRQHTGEATPGLARNSSP